MTITKPHSVVVSPYSHLYGLRSCSNRFRGRQGKPRACIISWFTWFINRPQMSDANPCSHGDLPARGTADRAGLHLGRADGGARLRRLVVELWAAAAPAGAGG